MSAYPGELKLIDVEQKDYPATVSAVSCLHGQDPTARARVRIDLSLPNNSLYLDLPDARELYNWLGRWILAQEREARRR